MDPTNPIIQLCVQGVEAESGRRFDEARTYFEQAWRAATDDVEACIAAHYIARNQSDLEQALWWNQLALARADKSRSERVKPFYASLHLNLAMAHEKLGQTGIARHHYNRAHATIVDITDTEHRVLVEYCVARGLKRTELQPS
jgi:tetratricopeptide (TPR) repeat protein